MMLKDIWFMFYNQYREYLKASSPPPPYFLERRATPGYPGKGNFYIKGQIEGEGRPVGSIWFINPEATCYSHFFKSLIDISGFEHSCSWHLSSILSCSSYHPPPPSAFKQWPHQASSEHAPGSFSSGKIGHYLTSWKCVQQKQNTSLYEKQTAILTFANLVGDSLTSRTTECL